MRGAVVALLGVLLVLGATLATGAPRRAASAPALRILSSSQSVMLRERSVRVYVRVGSARVVRLAVVGSPARTFAFRHSGSRVVRLPLSVASLRALTRCSRQRLVVRGGVPRRQLRPAAGRSLRIDLARCRPPAAGGSNPRAGDGARAGNPGGGAGGSPGGGAAPRTEGGGNGECDDIDGGSVCLQPWPNDYFTRPDAGTGTGRRLDLRLDQMPRNVESKPVDPTDINRADGFSPGNMILTKIPGLGTQAALDAAGAVGLKNLDAYDDANQPIVVIDAQTGERHPVWAEIDSNPVDGSKNPNEPARNVIIRPARNFLDGHRYIVALRNLRNDAGSPVAPAEAFRVFRDRVGGQAAAVEARRPHMEALFARLAASGISRGDLLLAWDFTVASTRSTVRNRMLKIRDHAFGLLGDENLADLRVAGSSPRFTVTKTEEFTGPNDKIVRIVEGTVTVPCYLFLNPQPQAPGAPNCAPGATFAMTPLSDEPLIAPTVGTPVVGTTEAEFICRIPRAALGEPSRLALYGHGLFGSRFESGGQLRDFGGDHNITFCATDWIGMACDTSLTEGEPPTPAQVGAILADPGTAGPNCDLPQTATILKDVSNFPKLVDRLQQGFVNFLYLGRAMIHPDGFASHAAFRKDATKLIDHAQPGVPGPKLFYDGNSQGGIFGGALTAIAPDFDRAVLGVPGMNYSTLLRRSVDFDAYATGEFSFVPGSPDTPVGLYDNYPDELERPLLLSLMQLLWDRADPNGYANHMTAGSPQGVLPNTPPHEVMLHVAFGDHQVANVAAEVEARTIGARTIDPYLAPASRSPYFPVVRPWGIDAFSAFPSPGSAIVMWDSGSPPPPTTNTPPRPPEYGTDPHSHPRNTAIAREQKSAFLQPNGQVINTCGAGSACYANGYTPGP